MGKYSISDFVLGDTVYHLSNSKVKMVIYQINESLNEISCRWIDSKGEMQNMVLFPEELGKTKDLATYVTML